MSYSDLRRLSNVTFFCFVCDCFSAQHPPDALLEGLSVFCRECIHTAEYLPFSILFCKISGCVCVFNRLLWVLLLLFHVEV